MTFRFNIPGILFRFLISLVFVASAASDSLEISTGLDGAAGFRGHTVYSRPGIACGASFGKKADGTLDVMGGINSSILVAGHLGDSGLVSEARNPGPAALGRLAERTRYRADLRSHSDSRFGVCLKLPSDRAGAAWERRREGDFAVLWAVPFAGSGWKWEFYGETGLLNPSATDDSWYPEGTETGRWPLYSAGSRIIFQPRHWDLSATFLSSCSPRMRPGGAGAASARFSKGPWLARTRWTCASEYFRDAGGTRADGPAGCSADVKYAPNRGLGFDVEYEWNLDSFRRASFASRDRCEAALTLRFGKTRLRLTSDWNSLAFPGEDASASVPLDDIGFSFDFAGEDLELEFDCGYEYGEKWDARAGGVFGIGRCEIGLVVGTEGRDAPECVCVGIDWKLKLTGHLLAFSVDFEDLGPDWTDGPECAGDFEASLRWIVDLRRNGRELTEK